MEQPADLSPLDFYNRKLQEYTVAVAGLSRRIRRVSFLRGWLSPYCLLLG